MHTLGQCDTFTNTWWWYTNTNECRKKANRKDETKDDIISSKTANMLHCCRRTKRINIARSTRAHQSLLPPQSVPRSTYYSFQVNVFDRRICVRKCTHVRFLSSLRSDRSLNVSTECTHHRHTTADTSAHWCVQSFSICWMARNG